MTLNRFGILSFVSALAAVIVLSGVRRERQAPFGARPEPLHKGA